MTDVDLGLVVGKDGKDGGVVVGEKQTAASGITCRKIGDALVEMDMYVASISLQATSWGDVATISEEFWPKDTIFFLVTYRSGQSIPAFIYINAKGKIFGMSCSGYVTGGVLQGHFIYSL